MAQNFVCCLPRQFFVLWSKYFQKKPFVKGASSWSVNNDISLTVNCLEQGNTGHFTIEVIWTLVLLVTSLCSERFSLFKHWTYPALDRFSLKVVGQVRPWSVFDKSGLEVIGQVKPQSETSLAAKITFTPQKVAEWDKIIFNLHLMPIPSASSKIFWPCSNFFDCVQYILNVFKFFWPWSKVIFYLVNLHIWAWSKIFDHIQKILNVVKKCWMQPILFLN